jgi:hypothetical protein
MDCDDNEYDADSEHADLKATTAAAAAAASHAAVSPNRKTLSPRMSPRRALGRVTSPLAAAASLQHVVEQSNGSSDEQRVVAGTRKRRSKSW